MSQGASRQGDQRVPIHLLELDGGRGTIQLREPPGNLSGSGSETHQHFSPADANCCYSLLLDPDARISIDLHKRLFLLVNDEKKYRQTFPYHGCALPTELGAYYGCAVRHRHCINNADEATDKSSTHQHTAPMMLPDHCCINPANAHLTHLPCAVHRPRSRCFIPPTSRPDRAATPALRLGNPMAPGRRCQP